jgi:hypothetical protein
MVQGLQGSNYFCTVVKQTTGVVLIKDGLVDIQQIKHPKECEGKHI